MKRALSDEELRKVMEAPESDAERRALDLAMRDPREILRAARLAGARRPRWAGLRAAFAALATCAAVLVVFGVRRASDPRRVLAEAQGRSRPFEPALDELPWAPYAPVRGARGADDATLRKLLEAREQGRAGAQKALAIFYAMRGEPGDDARADAALQGAPDGENERGVLLLLRGDAAAALQQLDLALRRDATAPAARFNRALALAQLGLSREAGEALAALGAERTPWSAEAALRARALQVPPRAAPWPRRELVAALLAARDPQALDAVDARLAALPPGLRDDLQRASRSLRALRSATLDEHGRLGGVLRDLRGRAVQGTLAPGEADDFARLEPVVADALLWAPALQLAGYVHAARGEWRAAERYATSIATGCRVRGTCVVEWRAAALDELADAAARDGDAASARRLASEAEAAFTSVDAAAQLGELQAKRAGALLEAGALDEASREAAAAARTLAALATDSDGNARLAVALHQAAEIALRRDQPLAATELARAALQRAREAQSRDREVDAALTLATAEARAGADAVAPLEAEAQALEGAAHPAAAALARARLAELLLQRDPRAAREQAERGLADARGEGWTSDALALHLVHARATLALGEPATAELQEIVSRAAEADQTDGPARAAAAELAGGSADADTALVAVDALRAAALHVEAVRPGWSRRLAPGVCVLALVPRGETLLRALATGAGGRVESMPVAATHALAAQAAAAAAAPDASSCEELWIYAEPPVDAVALVSGLRGRRVGVATSLTRLFGPEPAALDSALFVGTAGAVALPAAARERAALSGAGAAVREVSAPTPDAVATLLAQTRLAWFAVHGHDTPQGGFLQLAGDPGRLAARDVADLRLPGTRVVLAACEAAGEGGLPWAFARAGASAVVAAEGAVDDAAAAAFAERFVGLLARGEPFVRAAAEAQADARAARFVVFK